jgi:two-component system, LytTR family, response regulator
VRVLAVDDEKPARDRLRRLLERDRRLDVAGCCAGGAEAVRAIREAARAGTPVQLLLLDVQMPEMDGFGVLSALLAERETAMPAVVFASAHDEYALRAFDAHAVDYLLKPFSPERFDAALVRAQKEITSRGADQTRRKLLKLLAERTAASPYLKRFIVRRGERYLLVRADDVHSFEANGNYVKLRTESGSHMLRMTMAELERKLDPARFARIHRSTVVNIEQIKEITPAWHGDFEVHLADGQRLRLSRNFRERLLP